MQLMILISGLPVVSVPQPQIIHNNLEDIFNMSKGNAEDLETIIKSARGKFSSITKIESATEKLVINWLVEANFIRYKFLKKEVVKGGISRWLYQEPMAKIIAPFDKSLRQHPRRLPSTALIQCLQMDKPQKMSNDFNARNYKYAAALCIAKIKSWEESFEEEINNKGGLTRLVKLYSQHCRDDNDKNDHDDHKDKKFSHGYKYFEGVGAKEAIEFDDEISIKYQDKIVIARTSINEIEILREFPKSGILTYVKKK